MSKLGLSVELRITATAEHAPWVFELRPVEAMRAAFGELALMMLHDQGARGKWTLEMKMYPAELEEEAKKPL